MTDKDHTEELKQQNTENEAIEEEEVVNKTAEESDQDQSKLSVEDSAIQQEKEALENQLSELKDKYLRLHAEFDNYRKRTMKEHLELRKVAARDTMSALLPILDDFDRAKKNAEQQEDEGFRTGLGLVIKKLYNILEQKGLTAMNTEQGIDFDVELHEAITEIPAPTEEMKGKIVDTVEQGYYLNEKIIRHAKVVVGK